MLIFLRWFEHCQFYTNVYVSCIVNKLHWEDRTPFIIFSSHTVSLYSGFCITSGENMLYVCDFYTVMYQFKKRSKQSKGELGG